MRYCHKKGEVICGVLNNKFSQRSTLHLCKCMGHSKSSCKESKKIDTQSTPSNWSHLQLPLPVPIISNELRVELIDPLVQKSAIILQIVGTSHVGSVVVYKALVLLTVLQEVQNHILWLWENVTSVWVTSGKSSSHLVFVRNQYAWLTYFWPVKTNFMSLLYLFFQFLVPIEGVWFYSLCRHVFGKTFVVFIMDWHKLTTLDHCHSTKINCCDLHWLQQPLFHCSWCTCGWQTTMHYLVSMHQCEHYYQLLHNMQRD